MLNMNSTLYWKAHYTLDIFRPNWLGRLVARWRRGGLSGLSLRTLLLITTYRGSVEADNIIPTEGRNSILNVAFNAATQITAWYLAPFEGNYTPLATDTAANFTANTTECTAYDEATRVAWVEAAPSGQSITNAASKATFTFNATKSVYGAFMASASAKSATTGTLIAASKFSAVRSVVDNDQILLTYVFSASDS